MTIYIINTDTLRIEETFRESGLSEEDLTIDYGDLWFTDYDEALQEVQLLITNLQ